MTMTDGGDRRCDVPPALHHPTLPTPPILAKSTTIPATRHLVYSSLHRSRLIVGSSVTHFAITALSSWKCCDLQHYLVLTSKLLATEGVGAGGGNESKRQTTRQSTFGVLGKGGERGEPQALPLAFSLPASPRVDPRDTHAIIPFAIIECR